MSGFIQPGRLAASPLRNEAKTGSLALRLTCSPHQASSGRLLCRTLAWLLVERAIYKGNSFQFTRTPRLILALQVPAKIRRGPALRTLEYWGLISIEASAGLLAAFDLADCVLCGAGEIDGRYQTEAATGRRCTFGLSCEHAQRG